MNIRKRLSARNDEAAKPDQKVTSLTVRLHYLIQKKRASGKVIASFEALIKEAVTEKKAPGAAVLCAVIADLENGKADSGTLDLAYTCLREALAAGRDNMSAPVTDKYQHILQRVRGESDDGDSDFDHVTGLHAIVVEEISHEEFLAAANGAGYDAQGRALAHEEKN